MSSPTPSATFAPWYPGQRVGAYTIVKPVGQGGMAEVWLAFVEGAYEFRKPIALKRLNVHLAGERQFTDMFLDEAQLVSRLTHPGIAQVLELGEVDGSLFVAMEYVAGETLASVLKTAAVRSVRIPLEHAVKWVADASEALHYVHTRTDDHGAPLGVVHRDVSPQNLMVTFDGILKVLDFGIAKASQRRVVTETGQMKGKLGYIAPEQARGEPIDARADQFALGIVAFELVTATRLYGKDVSEWDLFRKVAASQDPYPTAIARDGSVPAGVSAVIARAMSRNPKDRFNGLDAFRAALLREVSVLPTGQQVSTFMHGLFEEQIATQSSLVTQLKELRATPAPSLPMPKRRRRGLGIAAAVAVLTAGGGAAWFALKPTPPPQPAVIEVAKTEAPSPPVPEPAPVVVVTPPAAPEPVTVDAGAAAEAHHVKHVAAKGSLTLKTKPWTEVFLGTRRLGETPLVELPLPAGTHHLKLVNEQRGISTVITVEIASGKVTTKSLSL